MIKMNPEAFLKTIRERVVERASPYFYPHEEKFRERHGDAPAGPFPEEQRLLEVNKDGSGMSYRFEEWRDLKASESREPGSVVWRRILWGVSQSFNFTCIHSANRLAKFSFESTPLRGYIEVSPTHWEVDDDNYNVIEIISNDLKTVGNVYSGHSFLRGTDGKEIVKGQPISEALDTVISQVISLSTLADKVST